ncbi:MAG: hypothetical protein ACOC40_01305 [Thermoplasmatota archaeon]
MVFSLLIFTSFTTFQTIDKFNILKSNFNNKITITDNSPCVEKLDNNLTLGTYLISTKELIKPNRYKVDVKPVGNNITLHIVDDSHRITKRFNDSISFDIDVHSTTVFISIIIYDPVSYQNWTKSQIFEVNLESIEQDFDLPLILMWSLVIIGGVYLGADTAYRRWFN